MTKSEIDRLDKRVQNLSQEQGHDRPILVDIDSFRSASKQAALDMQASTDPRIVEQVETFKAYADIVASILEDAEKRSGETPPLSAEALIHHAMALDSPETEKMLRLPLWKTLAMIFAVLRQHVKSKPQWVTALCASLAKENVLALAYLYA